jgi:hypothetical protein
MKYKVDDPWANRIGTRHVTTETPSTTTDKITLLEYISPNDPIILFTLYYTPEIMDLIVEKTNEYTRKPADDL